MDFFINFWEELSVKYSTIFTDFNIIIEKKSIFSIFKEWQQAFCVDYSESVSQEQSAR